MARLHLTREQAELSDRIFHSLRQAAEADLRNLADSRWNSWVDGGEAAFS